MTELDALLVLNAIPGLSNRKIKRLLNFYGSASRIFSLSESHLRAETGLGSKLVHNILHFSKDKFLKDEYNLITRNQVDVCSFQDEEYPDLLKEIDDSPIILYVKGKIPANSFLSIAIVGSRKCTLSGRLIAEKFASAFCEHGFVVVSGMARGIDTAAHNGALRVKGKTIAVLGSGLSRVYPKENKTLFRNIASSSAVISEYPMQTAPLPYNFPRRNRIISGLSLGVIVVEAAQRSGALITADFALDQGREVFAIPGNIETASSAGVNNLIKQGAKMITCIEEVLEEIVCPSRVVSQESNSQERDSLKAQHKSLHDEGNRSNVRNEQLDLEDKEQFLYSFIQEKPVHIDDLVAMSGIESSRVSSFLMQMELKKKIKQMPGKVFVKI